MTNRVSGPPQRVSRTWLTSSGVASPTASGTRVKSPRTVCRNGNCTSRECSCSWASSNSRDLRQRPDLADRFDIHRHDPQRRGKGFGGTGGQPLDGNVMRRPEQDDPLDLVARRAGAAHRPRRRWARSKGSRHAARSGPWAPARSPAAPAPASMLIRLRSSAGSRGIEPARDRRRPDFAVFDCVGLRHSIHSHAARQAAVVVGHALADLHLRRAGGRPDAGNGRRGSPGICPPA